MSEIYFLSIQPEYVEMILKGIKKWELRENPKFGILKNYELKIGDILFIVSLSNIITIPCMCKVNNILRGDDFYAYFNNYESFHWKEAGFTDDSKRNWRYFQKEILNVYSTAVELDVYPIKKPIEINKIYHKYKYKSWEGIGLTPAKDLKRYNIDGENVLSYFKKISDKIQCKVSGVEVDF